MENFKNRKANSEDSPPETDSNGGKEGVCREWEVSNC